VYLDDLPRHLSDNTMRQTLPSSVWMTRLQLMLMSATGDLLIMASC
jgi:hypothetical protein